MTYEELKREILDIGPYYFTETERACFYCGADEEPMDSIVFIKHDKNCLYIKLVQED